MVSLSWLRAPGASADAVVPAAVAVVSLVLLPGVRLLWLLSLPWGWLVLLLPEGCLLRVPLLLMLLVTTIVVALARAPALPAPSAGSTSSPGSVSTRMDNGQRVGGGVPPFLV